MAKLQIDELDLSPTLRETILDIAREEGKNQAVIFIDEYKRSLEMPAAMNYKQAASYLSTSFVTLKKLIKKGLIKVILIDGYERISKKEADRFLEENAK